METKIISISKPDAIDQAKRTLDAGGVIAIPTDTVYGIAVRVNDDAGINQLFKIKVRAMQKAVAVLIGEMSHVEHLSSSISERSQKLMKAFWPGALTIVLPKSSRLPTNLSPHPTIGIRMPDHDFARALMRRCGPLAATSANLSGREDSLTANDVLSQLAGRIELILDGGPTRGAMPSTVVDCTSDTLLILRQGGISEESLLNVWGED
jgi:L-threonylcarbamoyladenylate synthase